MSLALKDATPIVLGSGELYLGTVANPETALEADIVAALENVGAIDGGAKLTYKPVVQEIKSANRGTIMRLITEASVEFVTGVITWDIDAFERLSPATVTTDGTTGAKTMKLGGKSTLPTNYLRFIHDKSDGGQIIVNIAKAQNTSGFEFSFEKEKQVQIDYKFEALACSDGTLVEIVETFE